MKDPRSYRLLGAVGRVLGRVRREEEAPGNERGFTLIELMVVLLIMAVLLAIAIPVFLGVRSNATDRAAQSNLTNALLATRTVETDNQGLVPATVTTTLASQEPEFTYVAGTVSPSSAATSSDSHTIGVEYDGGAATLVTKSATGTCWIITLNNTGIRADTTAGSGAADVGIWYGKYTVGSGACTTNFSLYTTAWQQNGYPG